MKVRIYTEPKHAMQSGRARTGRVIVESADQGPRTPETLMGWTSAPDTLNQIRLSFESVEDAVRYVQGQDWDYTVAVAPGRRITPRNYTDNFRYLPPEDTAKA